MVRSQVHSREWLSSMILACVAVAGCSDTSVDRDLGRATGALEFDAVLELPLDEGVGMVAGDVSGNGNDGVLINGAAFEGTTGDGSAFAVRFDGADDLIDIGTVDVNGTGLTLAAWFRPDSFPGPSNDPRLISKATGTAANDHIFMLSTIRSGSQIRLRARVRVSGTTRTLIASSGDLAVGEWRHAAVTYDGAVLRLYLDAVEVGSLPLSGVVDVAPSVSVAVGGQPAGAGPRFFDGLIDDVRILSRALSQSELAEILSPSGGTPIAADDGYQGLEDMLISVDAANGVLSNDTDPDFDPLEAVLVDDVSNGVLNLNLDGSFDYIPDTDFSGIDQFTYTASDGSRASNLATVTLTIVGTNDAPTAQDDGYDAEPGLMLSVDAAAGVLSNDSDPELDTLEAILVDDVLDGVLTLNPDGSFDYVPNAGFVGEDGFTYMATDMELVSNLASVSISVSTTMENDSVVELPLDEGSGSFAGDASGNGNDGILVNGASFEPGTGDGSASSVRFDGADDFIDLGPLDVDGTGLTLALWFNADVFPGSSQDPRLISKATGTAANAHVFMLSTIRSGSAVRLRARVRLGGTTRTLIASGGDLAVGEWRHAALTYDGSAIRLYLDAMEVGSAPASGAVDIAPSVPVTVGSQPPGAGSRFFDGRIDDVRILSRALSQTALEQILGPPVGTPIASDDGYQGLEDTPLSVNAANGVLSNDTDPDFDPLEALLVDDVSNGALALNLDGSFDYIPDPDYSGQDQFTYRASDGTSVSNLATVTIIVDAENDAPTAQDDSYQAQEGLVLTVNAAGGVLANDIDPDQDSLEAILVDDVTNGALTLNADGSFDYTPDPGFVGQDGFTYLATDTELDSPPASVTISVTPASAGNDQPRFVTGSVAFMKGVVDDTLGETHAAAAADFTGDGQVDLVATDHVGGMVFWYEGDGAGGWITRLLDSSLGGAYPIGVGDVDGDGDLDVLAAGYFADTFVWYESDGSGGFTEHPVDTASNGAHSIVSGDLDDDGDFDLVTASQDSNTVAWYENDGTNGFTRRVIDGSALAAKRAEIGDLDGDGDMDVVSASHDSDEIAWHENDGNESFTKRVIDTDADGAYYVYPADVDGDGDLDVFSANKLDNTIAWYRNDGPSGFMKLPINTASRGARTVIAADINGDGNPDAVTASPDDDTVAWYENDGSGSFTGHVVDASADGAYGVFAIDVNHDGLLDILSASRDADELATHTQIRAHSANVDLGNSVLITPELLRAEDLDDSPSELDYTITAVPVAGTLELGGAMVLVGGVFTQQDIDDGLLRYVHDGVDQSPDSFDFSLADGGEDGAQPLLGRFSIEVVGFTGPIVELPMDEGVGTVAGDVSGQGNDGVLINGATFEASTGDGSAFAVRFDGVNDSIDLGALDVDGTGLTLSANFKADRFPGSSNDPRLISKATGTLANDHVFMLGTIRVGSEVRLRARVRLGGVTTTLIATSGSLTTDEWYHAAATYDGANLRLYLDGVEVGSSLAAGVVDIAPTVPVAVGSQPPGAGGRHFDGLIDDVRISSRAMSEAEIQAIAAGLN